MHGGALGERRSIVNPDYGKGAFVCSKPLQFLMCAGIVRRYAVERPEIYVVTDAIADTDGFFEFLHTSAYAQLFERIHRSPSYPAVAQELSKRDYDTLFIYDDRVSLYHLLAPLKRRALVVYEEGNATYKGDYRTLLSGLRRWRWLATSLVTGCGLEFGGGRQTDHVIVQYPSVYAKHNPRNARKALQALFVSEEIAHLHEDWKAVVDASDIRWPQPEGRVAFVLGTWGGASRDILSDVIAEYDAVYYKAHPHDGITPAIEGLEVITASWVPAEIYIAQLSHRCRDLDVFHFSSSVHLNCMVGFENVTFIDLLDNPLFVEVREDVLEVVKDRGNL